MLTAAPLGACRVITQAERAAHLAQNLGVALRDLRATMHDCENCPLMQTCLVQNWNASLDTALKDIAEEWGLC